MSLIFFLKPNFNYLKGSIEPMASSAKETAKAAAVILDVYRYYLESDF